MSSGVDGRPVVHHGFLDRDGTAHRVGDDGGLGEAEGEQRVVLGLRDPPAQHRHLDRPLAAAEVPFGTAEWETTNLHAVATVLTAAARARTGARP